MVKDIVIEIVEDHFISDALWRPEYVGLFRLEWFRRVANRLLYSPLHPMKARLASSEDSITVLEDIERHLAPGMTDDATNALLGRLIRDLEGKPDRMETVKDLLPGEGSYLVCQRADRLALETIFPGRVYLRLWPKSWMTERPTKVVITKKITLSEMHVDHLPDSLERIVILTDKRRGGLVRALCNLLFSPECRYPCFPITDSNNVPDIVRRMDSEFPIEEYQNEYQIASARFRSEVEELKALRVRQLTESGKEGDLSVEASRELLLGVMSLQSTILLSSEVIVPPISSRVANPNSEVWLGTSVNAKLIAIPVRAWIIAENIRNGQIEEMSPGDYDVQAHRLVLLDPERFGDVFHQRAAAVRQMMDEASIKELVELGALQYNGETLWPSFRELLLDASLLTRRLTEVGDLIGDMELAERLIGHLRGENVYEYDVITMPNRWRAIEDWIEIADELVPIPEGAERTYSRKAMRTMFDVVNTELGLDAEHEIDWMCCWAAVISLQTSRRKFIRKKLAEEQESIEITSWKRTTVKTEVPYYTFMSSTLLPD